MFSSFFIIFFVFLLGFYLYFILKFIILLFFSFLKFIVRFFIYLFYVFIYIMFGLADRELFEWEESFFYRRPVSDDLDSTIQLQGWDLEETDGGIELERDEELEFAAADFGVGRFLYFYFNPFSFYIYKRLNYEFIYAFLEVFFMTIFRLCYLFLFFFFFFFLRSWVILLFRTELGYFLYFYFFFILNFFRCLGFIYFLSKMFFYFKRIFIFWFQFFNGFIVFQYIFYNDQLEEMFYTFKYCGRMISLCKFKILMQLTCMLLLMN